MIRSQGSGLNEDSHGVSVNNASNVTNIRDNANNNLNSNINLNSNNISINGTNVANTVTAAVSTAANINAQQANTGVAGTGPGQAKYIKVLEQIRNSLKPFANASDRETTCTSSIQHAQHHSTHPHHLIHSQQSTQAHSSLHQIHSQQQNSSQLPSAITQLPSNYLFLCNNNALNNTASKQSAINSNYHYVQPQSQLAPTNNLNANCTKIFINCDHLTGANSSNANNANLIDNAPATAASTNFSFLNDIYLKNIIKYLIENGASETLINFFNEHLKSSTNLNLEALSNAVAGAIETNTGHSLSSTQQQQPQQPQKQQTQTQQQQLQLSPQIKQANHPIVIDQRTQQQPFISGGHKLLKKPSIPSFPSIESESSLYSGATSEKSALSSTSSVRSDSPLVNGNSSLHQTSILNLQRDRLLPDQPRIANSSGVPLKEESNRYHQLPSNYQHQVSLDSIGYSSGSSSSLCPQSQTNLYNVLSHSSSSVASSSSSSSAQHCNRQQQPISSTTFGVGGNTIGTQLFGSQKNINSIVPLVSGSATNSAISRGYNRLLLSQNVINNVSSNNVGATSTVSSTSSFRPTDPLPPPPLPPHRSVNVLPPPPLPSHPHSILSSSSCSSSITTTTTATITTTTSTIVPANQSSSVNNSLPPKSTLNNACSPNENLIKIKQYIKNQMAAAVSNGQNSGNNNNNNNNNNKSNNLNISSTNYVSCRPNAFSYASSASSSSPQRGTSPISFNSRFTAAPAAVLNITSGNNSALVSQAAQKLHNINLNQQPQTQTSIVNTGSTNSLLSTYSGQSLANSPPPSYTASNSSGRQSPTPTISSSSDYASIPMLPPLACSAATQRQTIYHHPTPPMPQHLHLHNNRLCQPSSNNNLGSMQNLNRKLSAISSSTSSLIINSQSSSSVNLIPRRPNINNVQPQLAPQQSQSNSAKHSLQPWSARQAISQSPIIMQSVKSQQVQKPILQTAIAPTLPPITVKITNNADTDSLIISGSGKQLNVGQCKVSIGSQQSSTSISTYASSASSISPGSQSSLSKSSPSKNPPPYPTSNLSNNSNIKQLSEKNSDNYRAPPPYPSAAKLVAQNAIENLGQNSELSMIKSSTPYSVSLSVSQNDSIAQIISELTSTPQTNSITLAQQSPAAVSQSQTQSSSSNQAPSIQVPTTDPPSYASSMAALAAQRAIVIPPNATFNTNNDNLISSSVSVSTTVSNATIDANLAAANNFNCDLVNTVESICNSQVSALQSGSRRLMVAESTGPPLPPKPSTCNLVPPPPPTVPPYFSSHLQQQQSNDTTSVASSSKGSTNNELEPITCLETPNSVPYQSSRENSASSSAASVLQLPATSTKTVIADDNCSNTTCETVSNLNNNNDNPCELCKSCDEEEMINSETETSLDLFEESEDGTKKRTHQSPIPTRRSLSKAKEKERREFKVRNYSPAAFKFYMEQHVENIIKSQQQREKRREQLESEMKKAQLSEEDQLGLRQLLYQKESNYIRLRRAKMDRSMFKKIKTIGVGAFGEVALVRKIDANLLYAMKTLRKDDVLKRNQVAHVKAERDILAEADCEWVVKLYYSFQDEKHLYFVMDYIPGGDLMSLLIKLSIFDESLARFYIAELVLAVESVHKMGFIHRDIKPDNILIDKDGHIKLTDFGLCTGFRWTHCSYYYHEKYDSMDFNFDDAKNPYDCNCSKLSTKPLERRKRREHQRCLAHSLVGTPNYIAPEVLMRNGGYTQLCDWWSVGVILYEMVVGHPPFYASSPEETQLKVIHWRNNLKIPNILSKEVIDLIQKLCCDAQVRLGKNGAGEIKAHPFFREINFNEKLREQKAPYIPAIKFDTDTSNFDAVSSDRLHSDETDDLMMNNCYNSDLGEKSSTELDRKNKNKSDGNTQHPEHAFFEFTFRRFFDAIEPFKLNNNGKDNTNGQVTTANGGIYISTTDSTVSETGSLISNGDYETVPPDNVTIISTSDSSHTTSSSLDRKNLAISANNDNVNNVANSSSSNSNNNNNNNNNFPSPNHNNNINCNNATNNVNNNAKSLASSTGNSTENINASINSVSSNTGSDQRDKTVNGQTSQENENQSGNGDEVQGNNPVFV